MFRGQYEHAIDGKGRTSLPARFRELLAASGGSRIVMTRSLDACIDAWSLEAWNAFEARLAELPQFDEFVVQLRRIYVSSATDCEIDKLGRILIPATLRQYANLKREAVWAGMGKHIELWDKARLEAERDRVLSDASLTQALKRRLSELGL